MLTDTEQGRKRRFRQMQSVSNHKREQGVDDQEEGNG